MRPGTTVKREMNDLYKMLSKIGYPDFEYDGTLSFTQEMGEDALDKFEAFVTPVRDEYGEPTFNVQFQHPFSGRYFEDYASDAYGVVDILKGWMDEYYAEDEE